MRRLDLCRPGDGGGLRATHTQKGRRQGMWTEGAGGWTESFPALLGLLRSLAPLGGTADTPRTRPTRQHPKKRV
eukprot:gene9072-biopygen16699